MRAALASSLVAVFMHSPKANASVYLQAEVEKDFDSSAVVWVQNGSSKTTEVAAYGIASDYVLSDELHETQADITNCWFRYKGETTVYRGWLGDENSSLVCKDTAKRPAQYECMAPGMYASKFEDYCLTLRKEDRAARTTNLGQPSSTSITQTTSGLGVINPDGTVASTGEMQGSTDKIEPNFKDIDYSNIERATNKKIEEITQQQSDMLQQENNAVQRALTQTIDPTMKTPTFDPLYDFNASNDKFESLIEQTKARQAANDSVLPVYNGGSGSCTYSYQTDSRGRRCGKRAASYR